MGAQHHRFAEAAAELESPETVRVVYLTDAARQALNADRSDYTHGGLKRSYIPAKMPNWGADDTWHPELAKVFLDGETWVSNRNAKGQLEIYTPVFDSSGKEAAAVVRPRVLVGRSMRSTTSPATRRSSPPTCSA